MSGVYAVGIDPHTGRILAGSESAHFGPSMWFSDDLGTSWREPGHAPIAFPSDVDAAFTRVWQFAFGGEPGAVYAGVEPTALFRSVDGGESFELVRALWDHPHRSDWFPGAGGAAVHTVLPERVSADGTDPRCMTVAMSTGGVYQTRDGGGTWTPANRGIRATFLPEEYPEYGQCVHKVAVAADGAFYLQNHHGVYRSEDPLSGWAPIADGLPADFGFAMVAHPHAPGTALTFPVISEACHLPPDYRLDVRRTDDGGATWRPAAKGLPADPYYSIVLRDAACTDGTDVPGFYFGTRAGDVYAATDDDPEWRQVAAHLPTCSAYARSECHERDSRAPAGAPGRLRRGGPGRRAGRRRERGATARPPRRARAPLPARGSAAARRSGPAAALHQRVRRRRRVPRAGRAGHRGRRRDRSTGAAVGGGRVTPLSAWSPSPEAPFPLISRIAFLHSRVKERNAQVGDENPRAGLTRPSPWTYHW